MRVFSYGRDLANQYPSRVHESYNIPSRSEETGNLSAPRLETSVKERQMMVAGPRALGAQVKKWDDVSAAKWSF